MTQHNHKHESGECRSLLSDLSLYVDGEAEDAFCAELERHMANCENCRIVVDTLTKTVNLYQEHGKKEMPGDARHRLFVALDLEGYLEE